MRTFLAVLAGFVTTFILAVGTDFILKTIRPDAEEPLSSGFMVLTLLYTMIYAGAGGFVTGRIARPTVMRAVYILLGVAFAVSLATLIAAGPAMPLWYKAASLILLIPFTLAGGLLARPAANRA